MSTSLIFSAAMLAIATASSAPPADGPKLDFSTVKYPQLIGIVCGVLVFTATITAVFVLLCKSGSWKKFMSEMAAPPNAPAESLKTERMSVVPSLSVHPELYDNLLEASRSLPMDVEISVIEGRDVTVRLTEKADIDILHAVSNGEPQFDESAYDPLRLWGWASLSKIGSNGKLERMDPPVQSVAKFSEYLDKRGRMTNISIVHNVYKKPIGMIVLSNNNPLHLSIEIDSIWISPAFQGHKMSHEAVLLVVGRLFELGYRRVTALTDSRHVIYRKFLERCGLTLEAVMRKHGVVHNRNRDTALYSILNSDWEDCEIKIKKHIGMSLKPLMHNAIEIDSGKEVEKQIMRDKKLAANKAKESGVEMADESYIAVNKTAVTKKKKQSKKK